MPAAPRYSNPDNQFHAASSAHAHEADGPADTRLSSRTAPEERLTLSRAIHALGNSTTVSTRMAALVLGVSERTLRTLLAEGEPPIEPLRYGKRLRWPSVPLAAHVGISANVLSAARHEDSASGRSGDALNSEPM